MAYHTASVKFLKWKSLFEVEKPFQIFMDLSPHATDQRKTNLEWEEKEIAITDFRGKEGFQLDTQGFTMRNIEGFTELTIGEDICQNYIPAVKKLLKRELEDVETVFVFDWRLRDSRVISESKVNFSDSTQMLLPSNFAHTDTCPISVIERIQKGFPVEATRICRGRIQAINVWKPLVNSVEEWPLAVCDGTTVDPSCMIETDSIRKDNISTNYYATFSTAQKWYYLHNQSPDEALIFKHFDSKPNVRAPYALHAAVKLPTEPSCAHSRRSIEVRALVFSELVET
ncbi:methyltransferase CmcJ [Corynespora cassiicola Philippines]|uniref:Methyltransferase CmcJ n=1 Tax=Corynespora cassiicola Philippines TaxID=1448308 RepID=A0A2T2N601_CORCC|nr:methyltransferase CmcJ [Corynespora cassiicola Philippines]